MKITISCATFARIAQITGFFDLSTDPEISKQLSCVRIEVKDGHAFAISTNQKIAAIEYIGATEEKDCAFHIKADKQLIDQCVKEIPFDSFLNIIYIPEILMATISTMLGYNYAGNAADEIMPEASLLKNWRTWFPDEMPKKSHGFLYFDTDHLKTLCQSSPSGQIIFPEIINTDFPIVLRDKQNPNWCGLFFGKDAELSDLKGATMPEWLP